MRVSSFVVIRSSVLSRLACFCTNVHARITLTRVFYEITSGSKCNQLYYQVRLVPGGKPLGAWPVREVRGALWWRYVGRIPDVESRWPAANVLERLRLEVESRRSIEIGEESA